MGNLGKKKKWYRGTYYQGRKRDVDVCVGAGWREAVVWTQRKGRVGLIGRLGLLYLHDHVLNR